MCRLLYCFQGSFYNLLVVLPSIGQKKSQEQETGALISRHITQPKSTFLLSSFCLNRVGHSGKSATIRESNHESGAFEKVRHNHDRRITRSTMYQLVLSPTLAIDLNNSEPVYVPISSFLLVRTGVWKISSVACGLKSIKIDYSDYPISFISRINEV